MQHSFKVGVAKKYGILEAVIIHHLVYWIKQNEANGRNFHNGVYWTYNTTKALEEIFPYVTQRQIRYAINHLITENVIQTGRFNDNPTDRTLWYAFTEYGYSMLQNCYLDITKVSNADVTKTEVPTDKNVTCYINSNNTNKYITNSNNTISNTISNTDIYAYDDVLAKIPNMELIKALKGFIKMRNENKPFLTKEALELCVQELFKLSNNNDEMIAIVHQSVIYGWKKFYPLKKRQNNQLPF